MNYGTTWTAERTRRLFRLAAEAAEKGEPLSGVCRTVAAEIGLSAGSVRNYYYAHLATFRMMPRLGEELGIRVGGKGRSFERFSEGEAERLVATVLERKARGESVRRVVCDLAEGDAKLALRLQNKYRSIVYRQRARTETILADLDARGATYWHPYLNRICDDAHRAAPPSDDRTAVVLDTLGHIAGLLESGDGDRLEAFRAYVTELARAPRAESHAGAK